MGEGLIPGLVLPQLAERETDFVCCDCGETIRYTDEVFLLQVVRAQRFENKTVFHDVIDERDPDGPFFFDPYYFCFRCWEKNYEEVRSDMIDEPPVEDPYGIVECVCCGSDIREMELLGTFKLGEFHMSARAPNGVRGASFTTIGSVETLCIYCLSILNEGHIDMWPNLSETGECTDCIQLRCWRGSTCECRCHHMPPDEDDDVNLTAEIGQP